MIPLTVLYDEYIDRPKLFEEKNAFEYIVPPTASGVGTKIWQTNWIIYYKSTLYCAFQYCYHEAIFYGA